MKVSVQPLHIGSHQGPVVYLLARRIGGHMDIEQMPDTIHNDREAHAYAANRWKVPECEVIFEDARLIEVD